jgi:hypothetical protein
MTALNFWILEDRDVYSRETPESCWYKPQQPLNLQDPAVVCPSCARECAPQVWSTPRTARASKNQCGDILLGPLFELIVSERFRGLYVDAGLTGLSEFGSVQILGLRDARYYAVRPVVAFTYLDESASGVVWGQAPVCDHCHLGTIRKLDRVVIDPKTWGGSDIFMATGLYGRIVVTGKFVDTVQKGRLTNFAFVPTAEYSIG